MATEKLTLTFSAKDEGAKALISEIVDRVEHVAAAETEAAAGAGTLATAARTAADGLERMSDSFAEGVATAELRTASELLQKLGISAKVVGTDGAGGVRRLVVAEQELAQANDLLAKTNLQARATTAALAKEAQHAAAATAGADVAQDQLTEARARSAAQATRAAGAEERAAKATTDQGQAARAAATATDRHTSATGKQAAAMATATSRADRLTVALRRAVAFLAAYQVGAFVKGTIDQADAISKLTQKTGIGAETLSVMANAALLADVSFTQLEQGTRGLARSVSNLRGGSAEASNAFAAIGLDAEALAGLTLDEVFLRVADALAQYEDGAEKATIAGKIFGEEAGTRLLPLLDDLAGDGFAKAREEAERLGVVLSDQAAQDAAEFNDNLTRLRGTASGVVVALAGGMVPALTDVMTAARDANAEVGEDGLATTIGETLGAAIRKGAAFGFALFTTIKEGARETADFIRGVVDAAILLSDGQFVAARRRLKETVDGSTSYADTFLTAYRGFLERIDAAEAERSAKSGARQDREGEERRKKLVLANQQAAREAAAARLAAEQQARDNELRIAAATDRQREAEAADAYQRGVTALDDFFAERARTIRAAGDRERAALEATLRAVQAAPVQNDAERIQRDAAAEAVRAQIRERTIEQETELAALERERGAELKRLTEALESFAQREQAARGETLAVATAAIEKETKAYAEALKQRGDLAAADQSARVAAFRALLTDRSVVDDLRRQAAAVESALGTERLRIQTQVTEGLLSEREGMEAIARLELGRLPVLRELGQRMAALAQAIGDPALIQSAADFNAQLDATAATADFALDRVRQFKEGLVDVAQGELANFLGSTINDVHSLGEAFAALAVSAITSIQRIGAEMIAQRVADGLRGMLAGGGDEEDTATSGAAATAGAAAALGAAGAAVSAGGAAIQTGAGTLTAAGTGVTAGGAAIQSGAGALTAAAGAVTSAAAAISAAASQLAAASAASGAASAGGAAATGFARGGYVRGAGTATSDSIAARLSHGEYVVRAAAVDRYGVELFDALNSMQTTRLRRPTGHRYAAGGLVREGAGGAAAVDVSGRVEVGLEQGLVAREMRSRDGRNAFIEFVQNNRGAIRSILGSTG